MGKKEQAQVSGKQKAAKRQQSVADKTFGLKNKNKSSKVQKFVEQMEKGAGEDAAAKRRRAEKEQREREKKAAADAKAEAAKLFAPVIGQQKVPFGVDPKTVVCNFFKQGVCTKGNKCKFSHDLDMDRKGAKKDLYTDARQGDAESEQDGGGRQQWTEEELRDMVKSKQGNPRTTTSKICKHFIEAVESGKYGWFWVCPNGGDDCMYKHSLPPGFTLKTNEQKRAERQAAANAPTITLEDFIESERFKLGKDLTPVTAETFAKWKAERLKKKEEEKRQAEQQAAKATGDAKKKLTGRQIVEASTFEDSTNEDKDSGTGGDWTLEELSQRVIEADLDDANKEE